MQGCFILSEIQGTNKKVLKQQSREAVWEWTLSHRSKLGHDDGSRLIPLPLLKRSTPNADHFYFAFWSLGKQNGGVSIYGTAKPRTWTSSFSHSSFLPLYLAHQWQTGLLYLMHHVAQHSFNHSFIPSLLCLWSGAKLKYIAEGETQATLQGSLLTLASWTAGVGH